MRLWTALFLALALAGPAPAQEVPETPEVLETPEVFETFDLPEAFVAPEVPEATEAPGGRVRVLDRLTSALTDLDLSRGESATVGRLTIGLVECRYPSLNPAADAWMHLMITDGAATVFSGWMLSSSPALSALDNPRYDVWVLSCLMADGSLPLPVAPESPAEIPAETTDAEG